MKMMLWGKEKEVDHLSSGPRVKVKLETPNNQHVATWILAVGQAKLLVLTN